jgi:hypothetical protein
VARTFRLCHITSRGNQRFISDLGSPDRIRNSRGPAIKRPTASVKLVKEFEAALLHRRSLSAENHRRHDQTSHKAGSAYGVQANERPRKDSNLCTRFRNLLEAVQADQCRRVFAAQNRDGFHAVPRDPWRIWRLIPEGFPRRDSRAAKSGVAKPPHSDAVLGDTGRGTIT